MPGRARPVVRPLLLAALAALVASARPAPAASRVDPKPAYKILGDDAPPLPIDQWIAGTPVDGLNRGRVYAVQLWNPKLGSSRETLPHMAELAKRFPGVACLTIAVSNPFVSLDATHSLEVAPDLARAFAASLGDRFALPVGFSTVSRTGIGDDPEFLSRSGPLVWPGVLRSDQSPSLTALIDADGRVAWVGNPMLADEPLARLVSGTFDLEPGRKEGLRLAAQLEELRTANAEAESALAAMSGRRATDEARMAMIESVYARHSAAAAGILAKLRYERLMRAKDYDAAYQAADALFEAANDDPSALNELAWGIVDNPAIERRDLARARKYAERAVELSGHVNGAILDTLAKAIYLQGDVRTALALQREAVRLADEGDQAIELPRTLALYERAAATRPAN